MFNGSWAGKNEEEIVDVSPETFNEFLQYFHLDRGKFTHQHIRQVKGLASKYETTICMSACEPLVQSNTNQRVLINCVFC